jgi:hypothetical protein
MDILKRVAGVVAPGLEISGDMVLLGGAVPMQTHVDAPLQNGDVSLLLYLENCEKGHIHFDGGVSVLPKAGRLLMFSVWKEHKVDASTSPKHILGGEARWH